MRRASLDPKVFMVLQKLKEATESLEKPLFKTSSLFESFTPFPSHLQVRNQTTQLNGIKQLLIVLKGPVTVV